MKISKLLLIGVLIIILAGVVFLLQKTPTYAPSNTSSTKIESVSDLDKSAMDLNGENLDSLDSNLNQLNADSSTF